eukprot:TRINITY_DN4438_c0_g4_i2.p1 TRINITY_DN4438_c0_g4~~TRINITY_DN4438_c0_g4_i2.p1  ORF type:complete len:228 (-),score=43.48 TRINITY_DN4438_c0_g4_i2:135-818(-)
MLKFGKSSVNTHASCLRYFSQQRKDYIELLSKTTPTETIRVRIQVAQGDVTNEEVDAITNAANERLQHGAGVAGAIVRKGGHIIQQESDQIIHEKKRVPTGTSVHTSGGNLKAKYVIHTVGPVWSGGNSNEPELLANCVQNSLSLADTLKIRSLSMPAISSGIFGFPKSLCAKILFEEAVNYFQTRSFGTLSLLRFTNLDKETYEIFMEERRVRQLKLIESSNTVSN